MSDAERLDMTKHFYTKYQGQAMEIRYFGKVGADASGLRHPQFLRMRPDRDPLSCTLA